MICDKCGCEHNSKSVCPKCGARVVYVNEDYERRRQEYLKAQKEGKEGGQKTEGGAVLPSGIHYSTEQEHNLRKGRDRASTSYTRTAKEKAEEDNELTGLLLVVEKLLTGFGAAIGFVRKKFHQFVRNRKKKRGRNNPVLNGLNFDREKDLKFDDGKETLDTSKLVLAHKVFKDKRVPILTGLVLGALLIAGLVTFLVIYNSVDRRRIIGVVAENLSVRIGSVDGKEDLTYVAVDDATLLAYTPDGRTAVLNTEDGPIRCEEGSIVHLNTDATATYTAAFISKKGTYYALIGCINEENDLTEDVVGGNEATEGQGSQEATSANETYLMYVGDDAGNFACAVSGSESLTVLSVSEEGKIVYLARDTAAYGVIAGQKIVCYDAKTQRSVTLTEAFTDYRTDEDGEVLYYIDEEKLYRMDIDAQSRTFLDDGVIALAEDKTDSFDGILYEKENGYYTYSADGEEPAPVLYTTRTGVEFYYGDEASILALSYAQGGKTTLYLIEDYKVGMIVKLSEYTPTATALTGITAFAQNAGIAYTDGERAVILCNTAKAETVILDGFAGKLIDAAYADGSYYLLDSEHHLECRNVQGETLRTADGVTDLWVMPYD